MGDAAREQGERPSNDNAPGTLTPAQASLAQILARMIRARLIADGHWYAAPVEAEPPAASATAVQSRARR